ncbi:MAG: Uma2 family endonuclease [Chloroflexaceae bacterium]|jgi:Uma2 family endonuclease|nr:Uma2 family endonuclease [Chloroflexaceae bacterium]
MATDTIYSSIGTTQEQVDDLLLDLMPLQGQWSEEAYLWLTDFSNRLVEFTDGYIEVLPMPTDNHQTILGFLYEMFLAFVRPSGGKVLFAPLRVRIRERKFREPDLLLVRDADDPRRQNRFWLGADLVAEIVSPDKPERDLVEKRGDYAEAGIPEYWIVNPNDSTVTVLRLKGETYAEHGVFRRGDVADSPSLSGFQVDVSSVFDAR